MAEYWVLEIVAGRPLSPAHRARVDGDEGVQCVNGDLVRAVQCVDVAGDDYDQAERRATEIAAEHTQRTGLVCKVTLFADQPEGT